MRLAINIRRLARRDPAVRRVARAWRELTGGTARGRDTRRRTLLACSAGADSSAMVLALTAAAPDPAATLVVAHVVHDMRPDADALGDRDAARELADALGLPFVQARVSIHSERGNAEAAARRLRYAALERLAAEHGCRFIATAHHAGDQFESMLMGLIRGSGPRGLAGIAESARRGTVRLIRPMLGLTRAECERLCREAGWPWRDDATNRDEARLRAALRLHVIPALERLRPGAARRAARGASLFAGAAALVRERAQGLLERAACDPGFAWGRRDLRREPAVVAGDTLRRAAVCLCDGQHADRLGSRLVMPVVHAIRARSTNPRRFAWPGAEVTVDAHNVRMRRIPSSCA
jgi:tRNA(Ile)-lysidine synthase